MIVGSDLGNICVTRLSFREIKSPDYQPLDQLMYKFYICLVVMVGYGLGRICVTQPSHHEI